MKQKFGVLLFLVLIFCAGLSFADDMTDPGWTISADKDHFDWKNLPYDRIASNSNEVNDDKPYVGYLDEDDIEKVQYYIKRGYTVYYRVKFKLKDDELAHTYVGYGWQDSDTINNTGFGNANGDDLIHGDSYYNICFSEHQHTTAGSPGLRDSIHDDTDGALIDNFKIRDASYDEYRNTLDNNLAVRYGVLEKETPWFNNAGDHMSIIVKRDGHGGDKGYIKDVYMQVAIVDDRDPVHVQIKDMYYRR